MITSNLQDALFYIWKISTSQLIFTVTLRNATTGLVTSISETKKQPQRNVQDRVLRMRQRPLKPKLSESKPWALFLHITQQMKMTVVLSWGQFCPTPSPGTLGRGIFACHSWRGRGDATGIYGVEVKDVAKALAMHKTAPHNKELPYLKYQQCQGWEILSDW